MPVSLSMDAVLFSLLAAAYLSLRFASAFPQLAPDDLRADTLITLAIGAYWMLDILPRRTMLMRHTITIGKYLAAAIAIAIIVVLPTLRAIDARHQSAPYKYAHDGLIQSEAATQFVSEGRNPYVESYRNTPMAQWDFDIGGVKVNPALEHYAYMPLTFLLPLPAQWLAQLIWGWFDQRYVFLVVFVATLLLSTQLSHDPVKRMALLLIVALNPLFVPYFVEGRNDVLTLFWLVLLLIAMQRQRWKIAAIVLALACATKQFAWFFVPFYLIQVGGQGAWTERIARLKMPFAVFIGVFALAILPWFLWNPSAFLDDITYFQSGLSTTSYPISGFSLGVLLLSLGVLKVPTTPFPYWLVQLSVGLPVLVFTLRRQALTNNLRMMLTGAGLVMFTIAFFSQFFHDNYFGYIITVMAMAWLLDEKSG